MWIIFPSKAFTTVEKLILKMWHRIFSFQKEQKSMLPKSFSGRLLVYGIAYVTDGECEAQAIYVDAKKREFER